MKNLKGTLHVIYFLPYLSLTILWVMYMSLIFLILDSQNWKDKAYEEVDKVLIFIKTMDRELHIFCAVCWIIIISLINTL